MPVKTSIVGLGIMGRRMLEHMCRHEGYTPVALWDPDPAACALALEVAPEAAIVDSAEAAIAAADLVYLACPPVPRKAYALKAAAESKAIFLEKPLGIDIEASTDLVDQLSASGVPAAVNFTQAAGAALTDISSAAQSGEMGDIVGVDIVVTYGAWPRQWQKEADWLRFRAEGGLTREVISHFLFFSERILGPLELVWSRPSYPADDALCETQMLARLETADGRPVTVMASVGGAQPDRQELTIKGNAKSRRVSEFFRDLASDGGDFELLRPDPEDPRAEALRAQLDDMLLCMNGGEHRLATPREALRVQKLVEAMLAGKG